MGLGGGLLPEALQDSGESYDPRRVKSAGVAGRQRQVIGPPASPVAIVEGGPATGGPATDLGDGGGLLPDASVRQPLGRVVPIQPEQREATPTAAQAPSASQSRDSDSGGGLMPNPSPVPAATTQDPGISKVLSAPVSRQQPLDAAKGYSDLMSSQNGGLLPNPSPTPHHGKLRQALDALDAQRYSHFGGRPTWDTLPEEQKHHGWRKVLDYAAALALGAYTFNPMAGMGLYQRLSRGPLREAQEDYDATNQKLGAGFERQMAMAKQQTNEDKAEAMKSSYEGRLANSERKTTEYGQKIVRYFQDPSGNWKGEQANGDVVDAIPPAGQRAIETQTAGEKFDEVHRLRDKEADRIGLLPGSEERKYYMLNGKLREPGTSIHVPSAESEEYKDWKQSFFKDNGREPNAQDIQEYKHPTNRPPHSKDRGTFEVHWQSMFDRKEKVKDAKRKQIVREYGADTPDGAKALKGKDRQEMQQRLDAVEADWDVQKQQLQGEKDAEADQYGLYDQPATSTRRQLRPQNRSGNNRPGAVGPTPDTALWSRSAWQKGNPKGDVTAAEAAAKKAGFQVAP
jgi:hypothetical protein